MTINGHQWKRPNRSIVMQYRYFCPKNPFKPINKNSRSKASSSKREQVPEPYTQEPAGTSSSDGSESTPLFGLPTYDRIPGTSLKDEGLNELHRQDTRSSSISAPPPYEATQPPTKNRSLSGIWSRFCERFSTFFS